MVELTYKITAADRHPLPKAYFVEQRLIGYDQRERNLPFASFFQDKVRAIQPHAAAALSAGIGSAKEAYDVRDVASRLSAPGYEAFENGWALGANGTMLVSVLTDMPGVTAAMWDWWFGWHSEESARYKLWHPDAHQFSTLGENRSADRSLTDRQRYQDNVSYVDEYIGPTLQKLAIWFCKPSSAGFDERPDSTVICARVGSSEIPVAAGWLFHQVRRTDRGAEMRSRFFLGYPEILSLPANAVANPNAARLLTNHLTKPLLRKSVAARVLSGVTDEAGRALFEHCAAEMNHLAHFLPELYTRFGA